MTDDRIQEIAARHTQGNYLDGGRCEQAIREALAEQEKYIKKLEFMIINGLGPKDIEDDRRTD